MAEFHHSLFVRSGIAFPLNRNGKRRGMMKCQFAKKCMVIKAYFLFLHKMCGI